MAASQPHKQDNQPLVFSHHKGVEYLWEYWKNVLVTGCSAWRQPAWIREEMLDSGNLFSSSWILPSYLNKFQIIIIYNSYICWGSTKIIGDERFYLAVPN